MGTGQALYVIHECALMAVYLICVIFNRNSAMQSNDIYLVVALSHYTARARPVSQREPNTVGILTF